MLVTVNTDASWHPLHKYAAYAFWAVCSDWKIKKSGQLKHKCLSSTEAELKCIVNALSIVLPHGGISKVIVNTDCLNAIYLITEDKENIDRYIRNEVVGRCADAIAVYLQIKSKKSVLIEFRHVKSHTGVGDARSYVNEWCDKEAKIHLWKQINGKKVKTNRPIGRGRKSRR